MGVAFFPVSVSRGTFAFQGEALIPDEQESGWSMVARMMRRESQRYATLTARDQYRASFDSATRRVTISGPVAFAISAAGGSDFAAKTGIAVPQSGGVSYTGSALASVVVAESLSVTSPGWSSVSQGIAADGASVGPSRWQTATLTAEVAFSYADAFSGIRTLRGGTWDVVSDDLWLARLRVTGTELRPQGRLPGVVQVFVQGVAVP